MSKKQIGIIVLIAAVMVGGFFYFTKGRQALRSKNVKQIDLSGIQESSGPANQGDVSPITGIACPNWNKRTFAVMQPADVAARPLAGLSQADMVFEMQAV